jgi:2-dehydro-3-deoxyphosphooctonate aldolase (KDO 8-P synthase)
VNVKKGQFLAPHNMASAVGKLRSAGCANIMVTERGSSFGYNRLVNDFISIPIMKDLGVPVVYDATHSVRLYGTPSKDPRGGEPQFIPHLARAGVAAGCDVLFMETHPPHGGVRCGQPVSAGRMEWMVSPSAGSDRARAESARYAVAAPIRMI